MKLLQKGDDNEFSKKKPADRYKQIFECMEPGLYSFLSANMRDILYNKTSAVLVLNALEPTGNIFTEVFLIDLYRQRRAYAT